MKENDANDSMATNNYKANSTYSSDFNSDTSYTSNFSNMNNSESLKELNDEANNSQNTKSALDSFKCELNEVNRNFQSLYMFLVFNSYLLLFLTNFLQTGKNKFKKKFVEKAKKLNLFYITKLIRAQASWTFIFIVHNSCTRLSYLLLSGLHVIDAWFHQS